MEQHLTEFSGKQDNLARYTNFVKISYRNFCFILFSPQELSDFRLKRSHFRRFNNFRITYLQLESFGIVGRMERTPFVLKNLPYQALKNIWQYLTHVYSLTIYGGLTQASLRGIADINSLSFR